MTDKTFGEWIFIDLHENEYLNKLYSKLINEYTKKLIGSDYVLLKKEISDLLTYADILSKSISDKDQDFHKNIAQNITTIIKKLYPDNEKIDYYTGSVLANVQNYVGLEHQCPNYYNADIIDNVLESVCKETHKVPFTSNQDTMFFNHSQKIAFDKMNYASMYSFSGPTSMGKTFLIKAFVHNLIVSNTKNNFVIIVPSKALINEIKNDFVKELGVLLQSHNYKVITTPAAITTKNSNYIMVHTQERYLFHLSDFPFLKIDYLFIDEAQKISDVGLRSAYFYKIIDQSFKLFPDLKLFFACPNIPNPEVYFELLPTYIQKEKEKNTFKFSPVNQHKCIYDSKKLL
jgi:chromosomal replication initiation ATPase DnaA